MIILDPDFVLDGAFAMELDVTVDGGEDDGRITFHANALDVDEDSVVVVDLDSGEEYEVSLS